MTLFYLKGRSVPKSKKQPWHFISLRGLPLKKYYKSAVPKPNAVFDLEPSYKFDPIPQSFKVACDAPIGILRPKLSE